MADITGSGPHTTHTHTQHLQASILSDEHLQGKLMADITH